MNDASMAEITADALVADGWMPHGTEGFIAHVGGLFERERAGAVEFGLLTASQHANRNGVVHGGMIMSFIDRAFGQTARLASGAPKAATVSLTQSFLAPLRIGTFATLKPQVARRGGTLVFMEGQYCVRARPLPPPKGSGGSRDGLNEPISSHGVWMRTHLRRKERF